ncbi:hypothetical protein OCA8868_03266 [Octadecabacter ascidiaceicola]|uniref:HTH-like domain-containing protein n=1 Tax=Octadecabacter ascidiaceicola TaxID=1655543 RepID=A0A238KSY2_9RHOB|nr:hypothetical protein OCA8868_03266 [Octadecabacter ascidiaceicola]
MTEELKEISLNIGYRRVGRLMRQNGISVVRTRNHKVATDSDHKSTWRRTCWIGTSRLNRPTKNGRPISATYGRAKASCIWRSTIVLGPMADEVSLLDLHSRRVIGWAVSNRMKRDMAISALKMAIALRAPPKSCIPHTDLRAILFSRLSENPATARLHGVHERQRQLL